MQDGQGENAAAPAPYEAVRADERYQFEADGLPPPEPPQDDASLFDGPFWDALSAFLGPLIRIVFWGGLIAFGLFVLYQIMRAAQDRWRDRDRNEPDAPIPYAPAPAAARTLLDDAAGLAAAGRYAEAVRLLLRRSIEDVEHRHPGAIRDSMTSREIAGLGVLTRLTREAFGGIAALVEAAHFAGRPLAEADWDRARALYGRLTETRAARAAS